MGKLIWGVVAASVLICHLLTAEEPTEEFRAVWLTTFAGLDWPKSFDPVEQQRSLLEIIERLYQANFNAIIFQARSRGDAFYKSSFEPWARELTGITGKDPGWDPLAFLIEHAHARGMEVHAWFNVYKVWGSLPIPFDTDPRHILDRHPEWARFYGNEWWLDPGEPGVHTHLMRVALDLVERYPIDGIHFDHIRYPGRDFDDASSYKRFGGGRDIHDWRRDNITNFVRDFYHYATAIRPDLKIGSAPIGVYKSVPGFSGSTAFIDYYQDPERWLREGIHDYIVPQVYWNIAQNPKFDTIMFDWKRRGHGRHIYSGIGIFRPEILRELYMQVSISRALEIPGQVLFRYSHLDQYSRLYRIYGRPATVPAMPWIDDRKQSWNGTEPSLGLEDTAETAHWMPVHLRYALRDNFHQSLLTFSDYPTHSPQRYIIYRSADYPINTNNPAHLFAVLPATIKRFIEQMDELASRDYHYLVSIIKPHEQNGALLPSYPIADRIRNVAGYLEREIILPYVIDPLNPDSFYLSLYVPKGASITLKVSNSHNSKNEEFVLVQGYLDAGFHLVPLHFEGDFTRCVVESGNRITERILKKPN